MGNFPVNNKHVCQLIDILPIYSIGLLDPHYTVHRYYASAQIGQVCVQMAIILLTIGMIADLLIFVLTYSCGLIIQRTLLHLTCVMYRAHTPWLPLVLQGLYLSMHAASAHWL